MFGGDSVAWAITAALPAIRAGVEDAEGGMAAARMSVPPPLSDASLLNHHYRSIP